MDIYAQTLYSARQRRVFISYYITYSSGNYCCSDQGFHSTVVTPTKVFTIRAFPHCSRYTKNTLCCIINGFLCILHIIDFTSAFLCSFTEDAVFSHQECLFLAFSSEQPYECFFDNRSFDVIHCCTAQEGLGHSHNMRTNFLRSA